MKQKEDVFDIIVIGAGAAGLNIASFMNRVGFKVLLIDKSDENIGGDCLNFGCVPSKALIHTARTIGALSEAKHFGVNVSGEVDIEKVNEYIRNKKEVFRPHESAEYFESVGMTVVLGEASFVSSDSIEVNGVVYTGKKIVIATGSSPRKLDLPGIENVDVQTNETIFSLKKLPKKLVIIGGGPIGMEIGQAFNYLGSEVTIIERGKNFLPKEDPDIAHVLQKQLEKQGVNFLFETETVRFDSSTELVTKNKAGAESTLTFDTVLASIGRVISVDSLNLEKAGVERNEKGGIVVDDYLRSTNKKVYVCGDAAGGFQFTHMAEVHAAVVLHNFFSPLKKKLKTEKFAWVTYTDPEIATFGLREVDLKEKGLAYEVLESDFSEDDRAIVDGYQYGKVKLFITPKGKLLGGSMVLSPCWGVCSRINPFAHA